MTRFGFLFLKKRRMWRCESESATAKYTVKWGGVFGNNTELIPASFVILPVDADVYVYLLYATFRNSASRSGIWSIVPLALFGGMLCAFNNAQCAGDIEGIVTAGFSLLCLGFFIQNGMVMVVQINNLCVKEEWNRETHLGARRNGFVLSWWLVTTVLGLFPAGNRDRQWCATSGNGYCVWIDVRALISLYVWSLPFTIWIENNVLNKKKNDEKEYTL